MGDRELKDQGNKLFLSRRYEEAISCYSKAIVCIKHNIFRLMYFEGFKKIFFYPQVKNGSIPLYYTNRALCYLKLGRWDSVIQDCRMALEYDNSWVKAHFFLGQALMETNNYEEAIKHLQRGKIKFSKKIFLNHCPL